MERSKPIREALKQPSFPKLIKKPDGTIVDERGEVIFTAEEAERITMEKLRDWGRDE